jgi:hypothetical protein
MDIEEKSAGLVPAFLCPGIAGTATMALQITDVI